MNLRHKRTMILALVISMMVTMLPPTGSIMEVQAAVPGVNLVVGFMRILGAHGQRNRVYMEAGATAEDVNAYYDGLIDKSATIRREVVVKAAAGETHPVIARAYTRIEASLEAERAAAIQMIEAEKNQARQDFNRTLVKEVTNILVASPGGQRIIRQVRDALGGVREAAVAVQSAVEEGRPLEALRENLAKQVGDIPIVQQAARRLGSAIGHNIDRALGGAISRIEGAIDDVQAEMGTAIDMVDQLDGNVAQYDGQERKPVSLIEDGSVIGGLVPVDRANAAADVAASAYATAAAINGALPLGVSKDTMRGRIKSALLDQSLERIRGYFGDDNAGRTFCSAVDRAQYEEAAYQLGMAPQTPADPGKATYFCCYDIQTQQAVYADMFGTAEKVGEETTEDTAAVGGETTIPVGVYTGVVDIPSKLLEAPNLSIDRNEITMIVEEDGATHGENYLEYSYSGIGIEDEIYYVNVEWTVIYKGELTEAQGELVGTITHHFVSSGPGVGDDPQDYTQTFKVPYLVQVLGNTMSVLPKENVESESDIYSFEITRQ